MEERKAKKIDYSERFLKSLGKLPKRIIEQTELKERMFKENVFDPRLKTHKLSGKENECWAFWVNYSYRIKLGAQPKAGRMRWVGCSLSQRRESFIFRYWHSQNL